MTPAQIVRFARNRNMIRKQDQRHDIAMAWLTAAWHRAKKMPSLKKATEMTETKRKATFAEIVAHIDSVKKVDG